MTYVAVKDVLAHIPNKFEAVRVIALECRRLNERLLATEGQEEEGKITTTAVENLINGDVSYYDARERREQERSEAMLAAAEGILEGDVAIPGAKAPESDS